MSPYYIYKITTPNQKVYIGVTQKPDQRWRSHCNKNYTYKSAISAAIQQYGKENVTFEILRTFDSEQEALDYEAKIVNQDFVRSRNTYNLCLGGGKPPQQNSTSKPIRINGTIYPSIQSAAQSLGYSRAQIDRRIKLNLIDYEFVEKTSNQKGKCDRKNLVRNPRVVHFNNETFPSYRSVCKQYNITKDELLKTRKFLGRDHVTLEEVEALRSGKKPITIDGILYESQSAAQQSTGLSMYKILEIKKGAPSHHLKKKSIVMIDLNTGQPLQVFETMTQAAQFVNASSASKICMCCKGQRQKAYGYRWSYWKGSLEGRVSR